MSALKELLQKYRNLSQDERAKGDSFERLIQFYLKNDPKYDFKEVWLWSDWAKANGKDGKDLGIDLVAEENETGTLWAIQCKFYAEDAKIYKRHVDSFFTESGKKPFGYRLIVLSTDLISEHVLSAMQDQHIECSTLNILDLEDSSIDWSKYKPESKKASYKTKKSPLPHQKKAIAAVLEGLKEADRGKLIMACGTGKTYTSLKIAEEIAGKGKNVLFLVPSLSLLSQTLNEWTSDSVLDLHSFAVCSDVATGKKKSDDLADISISDLAYPATTQPKKLAEKMSHKHKDKMTVVFSTYHSIKVISDAQKKYDLPEFDLIVCDEAHRTTGATLAGEEESSFVKVHDQDFIKSKKRLYMTATPRIFGEAVKKKAEEVEAVLCSMDDEALYGKVFYTINFSEAVQRGLLADYKVLVLAVDEAHVSKSVQKLLTEEGSELKLDDVSKIIGCWKALSKTNLTAEISDDKNPMQRAVAFCRDIKTSKKIAEFFPRVVNEYIQHAENFEKDPLECEARHVDGSFNAIKRKFELDWLKTKDNDKCHILSNARCLSEGVDVPALDAILFLNPRKSQIDIVQSVGRVMRKSAGKTRGYIILPIGIPADKTVEKALDDNERYQVVWQILQALRAHDDRFDAMINKIDLGVDMQSKMEVIAVTNTLPNHNKPEDKPLIGPGGGMSDNPQPPGDGPENPGISPKPGSQLSFDWKGFEKAIFAKLVKKCGNRRHWEEWAGDIAKIAETHITRIKAAIEIEGSKERKAFDEFLEEIRDDLNESISEQDAIEMLAQHLITKPVFDALFEGYDFAANNPVSVAMQKILKILDSHNLENETESLQKFYNSVRFRASGIDNAEARQKIIVELYDKFFRKAFPRMTEKLGIVYTPVEVVDFIIHSVNDVLQSEFGETLGSKGVHIIDPFVGTGTFITRLLQSGLIKPQELANKYEDEIHANEIVLLAYYIAAINIESVYHSVSGKSYKPFTGICLTDTFQLYEKEDALSAYLADNTTRRKRQKALDIRVIVGNPPYSAGQTSANDNNANVEYPTLDKKIRETYAANTTATNNNALYDSYIRAIRWASDRIGNSGVMAYVSNAGWIDGNAMDGLRKCLVDEFTSIYVFHLRGNARTSGEIRRKEKDNVFGMGTRTPIAISLFVKNPKAKEKGKIYFHDIGDYLSREKKLEIVSKFGSVAGINKAKGWKELVPDKHNDWLNQRDDSFDKFISIGDKKDKNSVVLFENYSRGLETSRDAWCYNSSQTVLMQNLQSTIETYNQEIKRFCSQDPKNQISDILEFVNKDTTKISWSSSLISKLERQIPAIFDSENIGVGIYRPFQKQWLYYNEMFNHRVGQLPKIFQKVSSKNLAISISGIGSRNFSVLIVDSVPCLDMVEKGQCFPLKLYEEQEDKKQVDLLSAASGAGGMTVKDGITDAALKHFQSAYPGEKLTKEDIFYYIYGLLHSEEYRAKYADNLSKQLPRIPCVKKATDFWTFSKAGRDLAELHINYEKIEPYPVKFNVDIKTLKETDFRIIDKMRFGKDKDKTTVVYNPKITMTGIPLEAYEYVVNGKPAIEWVMERQVVKTDKDSGIVNDANLYATETVGDAAYPLKLFQSVITVSLATMAIVKGLPKLDI